MIKIIFVTPQLKSGGGNRVFIELANQFVQHDDCDVNIYYPNNSKEKTHYFIDKRVDVVAFGEIGLNARTKLKNVYSVYKGFINKLKSDRSCVVIISDPILCMFLKLIPQRLRPRVIRFVQSDDYNIFNDLFLLKYKVVLNVFKYLTKMSYRLNVRHVFVSEYTRKKFIEYSGQALNSAPVFNPSVNKDIFKLYPKENNAGLNICLIGRVHPLKRLDDFLEVWHNHISEKARRKVNRVTIISTDDLNRFDLKGVELKQPISDQEIAMTFSQSDIFVSTSLWEGFSLPPLEAMHCGCTILSSNSGGINEYGSDNVNCLLYQPGNLAELKEKLELLIHNDELRMRLSARGIKTTQDQSWKYTADKFIDYLLNIN